MTARKPAMAVVASSLNIAMSFFLLFYRSFKNISPLKILFRNFLAKLFVSQLKAIVV